MKEGAFHARLLNEDLVYQVYMQSVDIKSISFTFASTIKFSRKTIEIAG